MNIDLIAAVLTMHAPVVVSDETGVWRTLCSCGDIRNDDQFHRHVAEEVAGVLFPPEPPPAWSIPGV